MSVRWHHRRTGKITHTHTRPPPSHTHDPDPTTQHPQTPTTTTASKNKQRGGDRSFPLRPQTAAVRAGPPAPGAGAGTAHAIALWG